MLFKNFGNYMLLGVTVLFKFYYAFYFWGAYFYKTKKSIEF